MQENRQPAAAPPPAHELTLKDRRALTLTGVVKVLRCDGEGAAFKTGQGVLTVAGQGLAVQEVSLEAGLVRLTGLVESMEYAAPAAPGGWLRRLAR